MKVLKQYLPSLGMVLATVLGILTVALQDNTLSLTEFLNIAIALTGAVVTFIVPRLESVSWLKPALAGLTAGLVFLVSAVVDGHVSAAEWTQVAIQVLAGLGVLVTNKEVPVTPTSSELRRAG